MNEKIRALMQQRAKAITDARAMIDKADAENRDMTSEERSTYNAFDGDIDKLTERIKTEERQEQREVEMRGSANGGSNPGNRMQPGGRQTDASDPTITPEYRQSVLRYLAAGVNDGVARLDAARGETRDILGLSLTGEASTGGILAPTILERVLLDYNVQYNVMRKLASVRSSNSTVDIPYSTSGTTAYHIAEGAAFTKSKPVFAKVTMKAYKTGALSVVTHESMQDIFLDLENWIRDDFGNAFALLEEEDFITGDGDEKPYGFLTKATKGLDAAAETAITADELIDLQHALGRKFRANARFMVNDSTVKAVRKLKDGNEQYIWQPGLKEGVSDMLLGRPLETSDFMPVMEAGKKAVAYGDFNWYRILDRKGLFFQRLVELYAESGQVGFLAYRRYDGNLLDTAAIKTINMKASGG